MTSSLSRKQSRGTDSTRQSPCPHGHSPGIKGYTKTLKEPIPETKEKNQSAESIRSDSPGSDSVFFPMDDIAQEPGHCHHCGREVVLLFWFLFTFCFLSLLIILSFLSTH